MSKQFLIKICLAFSLFLVGLYTSAEKHHNTSFTVVLDPGHGGKDPGAIGRISREKNINLSIALALGKLIEKNCPDTKVIYTRKTDVFVPLDKRAQIANKAKADLFISLHTNALSGKKNVRGTETYTLGMARADENLEVAKRENSVILVENDYQARYEGFDPKSAESYIIFELMQDKYMEQSVDFARSIQHEFKHTARRTDRGVHQAGFLVLRATTMPSVLVELGYISTADEERYLNSAEGINKLALSLYRAFLNYKGNQLQKAMQTENAIKALSESTRTEPESAPADKERKTENETRILGNANLEKATKKTDNTAFTDTIQDNHNKNKQNHIGSAEEKNIRFKIQILSSSRQLHLQSAHFKGLKHIEMYKEGNLYKYTTESTTTYTDAIKKKKEIQAIFPGAFIIAFKGEEKIPLSEAIKK